MLRAVCLTCRAMTALGKSGTLKVQNYVISVYVQTFYPYKVTAQQQQVIDKRQHSGLVVVKQLGRGAHEQRGRGETGEQMLHVKARVQGKIQTREGRVGTKCKDWLAGDDGKGTQSQK